MTRTLIFLSALTLLLLAVVRTRNERTGTGLTNASHLVTSTRQPATSQRIQQKENKSGPAEPINDIIETPEDPQMKGYTPNSIKDFEASDPLEGISMIAPPTASNTGNAVLSFNMNLPEGRQGMEPSLSIQYNNEGGNTWMGTGWNMVTPAISLDTRWGVPRYDPAMETEMYMLNGEQLAPVSNRTELVARSVDKRFYPRIEGSFNYIIRHGSSPSNYYWEVTQKDGITHYYGGKNGVDNNAVLKDENGHIGYWALVESRDPNGNFVRYEYNTVSDPGTPGSTLPGKQIYPTRILYTGNGTTDGPYKVEFVRDRQLNETKRRDVTIDARLGFKIVNADLLRKVNITYSNQPIRSYEFNYTEGAFYKMLLKNIKELDNNNVEFYSQQFDYYDDIRNNRDTLDYRSSDTAMEWTIANDGLKGDVYNPVPQFEDNASVISTATATSKSGGAAVTIGSISGGVWSKKVSVGGNFNYGKDNLKGVTSLIDINGDALPDKVFKDGDYLYYRANLGLGTHSFGEKKPITGINEFNTSETTNMGGGGQALPYTGFFGINHMTSNTTINVYFADFNGDGLMDIAKDGKVYFNHLDIDGNPQFVPNSELTPSPIYAGVIDPAMLQKDTALQSQQERNFPLQDIVRCWQAPVSGTVNIMAPVQLQDIPNQTGIISERKDGVRASIQLANTVLWSTIIGATDFTVKTPANVTGLSVTKGQRIYFRLQSIYNGEDDVVSWDPVIQYTSPVIPQSDVQHKTSNYYKASEDFILHGKSLTGMGKDGAIVIDGTFKKDITSDSVFMRISRERAGFWTIIYERGFAAKEGFDGNIIFPGSLAVLKDDQFQFSLVSRSYIDRSVLSWKPHYVYVSATDGTPVTTIDGKPTMAGFPMPDNSNFNYWHIAVSPVSVTQQDTVTLWPQVAGGGNGTLWFTVKGNDTVYAQRHIYMNGGTMETLMDSIHLIRKVGEPLFLEYATDTMDFALALAAPAVQVYKDSSYVDSNGVTRDTTVLRGTLPANLYTNPSIEYLGPLYRGWGGFVLKGDKGNGPIEESKLNLDELLNSPTDPNAFTDPANLDQLPDPTKTDFVMLYPDIDRQAWLGYDTSVYIKGGIMSSSRLSMHDVFVDSLGPGSTAVNKTSTTETESVSAGITAGGVGPSGGTSTAVTTINTDMMDMNGDRYPDLLNDDYIQYTLPHGGLSGPSIQQAVGATLSSGLANGFGFGGEHQWACTGGASNPNKSAVAAQRNAAAGIGVSGNGTWNEDQTGSSWLDMNGDGLFDRVYQNGNVALNLGYSFGPAEPWGYSGVDEGSSVAVGAGFGVNIDGGSIEGGFGISRTEGQNSNLLVDLNGDGLADHLSMSGDDMRVRFNTGTGFGPLISWKGFDDIASIYSVGESYNVAVSIAIPIYIIFTKIVINPSGIFGHGTSRQEKAFMDIDGDGFADYVQSRNDGQLFASSSSLGRTNMLSTVKGPVGGSFFTMDYERVGNTYEMPQSKWVMKNVTVFDGVRGDGVDTMRQQFSYEGGYQNRHEREFYGFNRVVTHELNTANNNIVYRRQVQEYLNSSYYNKGLLTSEWTEDAAGNKYTQLINTYDIRTLQDSVKYPALVKTQKLFFEGAPAAGATTVSNFEYDLFGNVTKINDAGDGGQQDMLMTAITYHTIPGKYIKSVPSSVEVTTTEGVKRKRTTTVNNEGDITSIQQFLADGTAATTNIDYDDYGNVSLLTNPANHSGQRMSYTYEYDNAVHSYPTKVTDAFNNITTNTYDYRFGAVTSTVSINNERTEYIVDNHGRITRFTGPYELAAGHTYTMAIEYHPEAKVPYSITRHFDPEYNADINVINFADGLGRSIQLKKQVSLFKGKDVADELRMVVSGKIFYDAFGRSTKRLFPVTEAMGAGNTILNTTQGRLSSTTAYDVEDRVVKTVLADGATTNMAYTVSNGMTSKMVTDALNNRRETLTDVRNRKRFMKVYGPAGTITTRYDYNALNELIKVLDNNGNTLINTYDNLGRNTSVQHPDAGRTDFVYDHAGNMTKKITPQIRLEIPNGGAIQYKYDYDRLTDIDYPRNYQNKVRYTYGEAGSGAKAGRVILQEDASGGQEFYYSMQGQVVKTIRTVMISPVFATTYVSEQEFDSWNRLKKMVYPDGEEIMYHYNRGGSLKSMDATKVGNYYKFVDQLGYDEYDQRVYMRYSNGTENYYKYDSLRRHLTQLQALSPAGQPMMNNKYTYDAVSNVLGFVNDATPGGGLGGSARQQYHYDNLYRLDSASGEYNGSSTGNYNMKLAYDNLDNITHKTMRGSGSGSAYDLSYTYGTTRPHQAIQIGNDSYNYDLNGNQLGYGDIENFYDEESRLMAVINKGVLNLYTYDADDNRAVKSSGGMQGIWVNGAPAGTVRHSENYTVYVSPYISAQQSTFTKHYYIEGQRIASKPGHGTFTNISFPQSGLTAGGVDYLRRAALIEQHRNEYYASLGVSPGPPTDKPFWARPENSGIAAPVFTDTTVNDTPPGWPGNTQGPPYGPPVFVNSIPLRDSVTAGYGFEESGHIYEGSVYFYHFDRVSSTSYITNFQAEVTQHVEYSPFGEVFANEHTGSFETSYLFNGKGLDGETGLYFYNPYYYNPALSQWLTVLDPTGEGSLGGGTGSYLRRTENEEEEIEGEDATPIVSKISYGGSVESEKAWVDKKLNTKKKDRLPREIARKLSKDPRLRILGNKTGNRLVDMRYYHWKAFHLSNENDDSDDDYDDDGNDLGHDSYRRSLSSRNSRIFRYSTVNRYSNANVLAPGDARRNSSFRRFSNARMGSNSQLRRASTSMRRFSNARVGNVPRPSVSVRR